MKALRHRYVLLIALVAIGCDPKGGDSTDSNGESDADTDTDADTDADLSCTHYCELMEENCNEEMLHPMEWCMTFCETEQFDTLPVGTSGDTIGDTLACRVHWAESAGSTPDSTTKAEHCANASASGGDQCGDWCDSYCNISLQMCSTDVIGSDNYASEEECQTACAAFPTEVLDGISQTDQLFGYGDTVQCRLHHLHVGVVQGETDPSKYGLHCPHASQSSTDDTCVDDAMPNVANYCTYAATFCTDEHDIFPDAGPEGAFTYCKSSLDALTGEIPGPHYRIDGFTSFTDTATNSLGCLNYWATLTGIDPATNCPKADWNPDNWIAAGGAGVCQP